MALPVIHPKVKAAAVVQLVGTALIILAAVLPALPKSHWVVVAEAIVVQASAIFAAFQTPSTPA